MTDALGLSKDLLVGGVAGIAGVANKLTRSGFSNVSSVVLVVVIIIIVTAVALWIMSIMATYRLTGSTLQTVLCLFFGSIYLFFAWVYYGMNNYKLVQSSS